MKLFEYFHDTINLLKNTFQIIAKNKKIILPTFRILIAGGIFLGLLILGVILSFFNGVLGWILIVAGLILIMFVFPFLKTYYQAAQVWITYKAFKGEMVSYKDGTDRAKQNKGDIFSLTFFGMIASFVAGKLRNSKGFVGFILKFLARIVDEGWDLVSSFLLPACIIQEQKVMEVIRDLKEIKRNVPGTLAGVFGLDFAGDMIIKYVVITMIVIAIPLAVFFWPAFIVWFIITMLVAVVLRIFVDMMKTVYFTLFYMSVTNPLEISEMYKNSVTNYLMHKNVSGDTRTFDKGATLVKLIPYVLKYRQQGHSDTEISSFLVQYGWPQDLVNEAILRSRRGDQP